MVRLMHGLAARSEVITDALVDSAKPRRPGRVRWKPLRPPRSRSPAHAKTIPTIFIWGENDIFAAPSHGRELEALLPDIKFHGVKTAGHQVQTDQPEIVAEIVDNLISRKKAISVRRSRAHRRLLRAEDARESPTRAYD
jgi:pimeloyl-ACP methyl ester carboxylesterase